MIVLHKHRLIVMKAWKTASSSFEIGLSKYANRDDIITPLRKVDEKIRAREAGVSPRNYRFSLVDLLHHPKSRKSLLKKCRWPKKFWGHMSAEAARSALGYAKWTEYLKVSIIRDPLDRILSEFFWASGYKATNREYFLSWFKENYPTPKKNRKIYMIGTNVALDLFIRYENIQSDLQVLENLRPSLRGISETTSCINAKGSSRPADATVDRMLPKKSEIRRHVEIALNDELVLYRACIRRSFQFYGNPPEK